jgi:hypothetical protein
LALVLETDENQLVPYLGYMSGVPSSELPNCYTTHKQYPYSGITVHIQSAAENPDSF